MSAVIGSEVVIGAEQAKHNGDQVDSAWSAVVASRDHRLVLAQVHVTHEPWGEWPL